MKEKKSSPRKMSAGASSAFDGAYAKLNAAQKEAVDAVEGPVMVIAGPGTGKTHILTLRIANILKRAAHARPESILALTFTESASRTVGRRLGALIGGETARKVGVFTFHSFAEDILRRHPEAFPELATSRLMGELEQTLLWREVLAGGNAKLLRTPKSPFHYLPELRDLENDLTRERVSLDAYRKWLAEEQGRIEADERFRYVKDGTYGKAGEMKPEGEKRLERLEKGAEAIRLIETYRALKDERGVYGYTDVLRIAVEGLKSDDALRADLQERYQYVLADEHQDANALQHALLDALAFDEHPNLFIVGDEKQAIFGFQGADSTHFRTFLKLYPRTKVITLTDNYRSYQQILDTAHTLLKDLPAPVGEEEHARLAAHRGKGGAVELLVAEDPLAEREEVATRIEAAIAEGIAPHDIAVITMKNATADFFALHLRAKGIPTLRAGNLKLDERPSVRFLLSLMQAVAEPSDSPSLRDSLLAPWWDAPLAERMGFLRRTHDHELMDALTESFPTVGKVIAGLQEGAVAMPPVPLFSKLLEETGARAYFLAHGDRLDDIPLVRQLVMHVEDLARRNPNATFGEIMQEFADAREHGTASMKSSRTEREGQVTVITAHKAKGMEFERVFIAALTEQEWNGKGRASLIPSPFLKTRELEEVVRLFYVALTRAKSALTLSYPEATGEGKELSPLSLIPQGIPEIEAGDVEALPLFHSSVDAPKLVRELTRAYLAEDGLSPSAFNEYLVSPPAFFAKRVLRLREPENQAIVIGNGVHAGIAGYIRTKGKNEEDRRTIAYAELERSFARSLLHRDDTLETARTHARSCLAAMLEDALLLREALAVEEPYSLPKSSNGREALLRGKVDAVFKGDDGACIVDFKTSSHITKGKKEEFERQIAFYDLLLRENGIDTTDALIVQIGEDGVKEHPIALTNDTRAAFTAELEAVLNELMEGTWREGEPSPYDDLLKLFV